MRKLRGMLSGQRPNTTGDQWRGTMEGFGPGFIPPNSTVLRSLNLRPGEWG
jgi:hypothetical protein